ncbi:MAG: L-2-amino-thiazoline-4-carboxylic acid hydrolase [Desulfobacterales bacterium]|nr:L-2-amino-thiazoline-4-carboxylic acid hydrolase [Desulfobacterales bacterium]
MSGKENKKNDETTDYSIDRISEKIGVLTRRETEARILIPIIDALGDAFGRQAVVDIVRGTIEGIAKDQGKALAEFMGGDTAQDFQAALEFWTTDNALEIEVKKADENELFFDVTRCKYAEMYKALGAADLGAIFSCNRDAALIKGFNADADMTRTRTIMEGNETCDFKYRFPKIKQKASDTSVASGQDSASGKGDSA